MNAQDHAAAALGDRVDALGRFLRAVGDHVTDPPPSTVDADAIPAAHAFVDRATVRLRLSGEHTVAALAGATGGGKSILFNALAGMELSVSGPLRPTTGEAHACIWGEQEATALLDWLGVAPARRFVRESPLDGDDEAALRGLVLLDLPDVDSIASSHRVEAERLMRVVDLVIWVLDPQKYADRTIHEEYLQHMGAVRDVTVVVFNQVDRLSLADAARCRADLARLVEADGMPGVPLISTSATTGDGVGELRTLLEKTVAGRHAALSRMEGELDVAVERLAPLIGSADVAEDPVSREVVLDLAGQLGDAVGVRAVAVEAGRAYAGRAALPGWPFRRRRAHRGRNAVAVRGGDPAGVALADATAAAVAVRHLADRTSPGLPEPWPDDVRVAALSGVDRLPHDVGHAVEAARPRRPRVIGWMLARVVWWLSVLSVLGGGAWLAWWATDRDGVADPPTVGGVWLPLVLIFAGAVVALLVLLLGRPLAAARARRFRAITERRLRDATAAVARDVVAPVRSVLRDYADARIALGDARNDGPRL